MNINIKLNKTFTTQFNKLSEKYGEEMLKLNGFNQSYLSLSDFIDNFIDKTVVGDASIDSNSNVSQKDMATMISEMGKPQQKLLCFNKIYYELQKEYGVDVANNWLEAEWNGDFYLHDAHTSTLVPYCYSYDLQRLAEEGLFFIENYNNLPPKHFNTFVEMLMEFVSFYSNRSSGSVGLSNFLIYAYYFWKKDIENGYYTVSPESYKKQVFSEFIYKLNQPYLRGGIQSAFTNISIFDRHYFKAIFGNKLFPDGSPMALVEDEFIEFQKDFMDEVTRIRQENMMTFPVITFSLLKQNGKFKDEEFAKWCCQHNMQFGDANFYISDNVTALSNCCRLVSNIDNLGFFNSVGGTALEVGSVKVNTINLARIAYQTKSKEEYLNKLQEKVLLCLQCLDRVRHIIKRNIEKGILKNYGRGMINLKSQYNTVGINGMFEAVQELGFINKDKFGNYSYTEEGLEFAEDILKTIKNVCTVFCSDKDYMANEEQIPGERCASVLMQKDQLLYPNKKYPLPLYGNQWIPLAIQSTLNEKIKVSARLDKACEGGAINHVNLDAPLKDFNTAWKLLNKISDAGVVYFAFNLKISACKHNHGFFGNTCPICGEPMETTYQRIVGYLTPTTSYSKTRREEFQQRKWLKGDELN